MRNKINLLAVSVSIPFVFPVTIRSFGSSLKWKRLKTWNVDIVGRRHLCQCGVLRVYPMISGNTDTSPFNHIKGDDEYGY